MQKKNKIPIFEERFTAIVTEQMKRNKYSEKEIAQGIGIRDSQLFDYKSGYKAPSANTLISISKYFNVSVDYLLGISDVEAIHEDENATAKTIGLSARAISKLKRINEYESPLYRGKAISFLNSLIESKEFDGILREMQKALIIRDAEGDTYQEPIDINNPKKFYIYPKDMYLKTFIPECVNAFENILRNILNKGGKTNGKCKTNDNE